MSRVLILEDDHSIGRLIESVLSDEGHETEWLQDTDRLWTVLETEPPDLMLVDVLLGGSDGRTWYESLRARGYEVPVLLVSAVGGLEEIATKLGVGYVQKPFDLDDLVLAVTQALASEHESCVSPGAS